jgi:hypothetical protein
MQKPFNLMYSHLYIFAFVVYVFGTPYVFLEVLGLMSKSLVHFDLILYFLLHFTLNIKLFFKMKYVSFKNLMYHFSAPRELDTILKITSFVSHN